MAERVPRCYFVDIVKCRKALFLYRSCSNYKSYICQPVYYNILQYIRKIFMTKTVLIYDDTYEMVTKRIDELKKKHGFELQIRDTINNIIKKHIAEFDLV